MTEKVWLAIGGFGQALFAARFLAQWVASERKKESVMPVAFWWLSLAGGLIVFVYALHKQDPVFYVAQGAGLIVYARNLMLVYKSRRPFAQARARSAAAVSVSGVAESRRRIVTVSD